MEPTKLSDIVELFFEEKNLPLFLKLNILDHQLYAIRESKIGSTRHFGVVSNRRTRVCVYSSYFMPDYKDTWLNSHDPQFFERLYTLLNTGLNRNLWVGDSRIDPVPKFK